MSAPAIPLAQKPEHEPLWAPEPELVRQWASVQAAKKRRAPKRCIAAVLILTIMGIFFIMFFLWRSRDMCDLEMDEAENATDFTLEQYNPTFNDSTARNQSKVLVTQ